MDKSILKDIGSLLLRAGTSIILLTAGLSIAADVPVPQQGIGEHSTLCTSDGNIRDDELADWVAENIPKDDQGNCQVKDVKIMVNSCYGGGLLDDFQRIFGPGGACEGVPWVAGSASSADECAEGWDDDTVNHEDNEDDQLGSCWTDALAGRSQGPDDDTDGAMRRSGGNVMDDFEEARDNDDSGPNHDDSEHPVVASGNGGENINWDDADMHVGVIFGGSQTNERHHNNIDNVGEALREVWDDESYIFTSLDGGTEKNLKDAIKGACSVLDSNTQLVLYFDDHGDTEFDIGEYLDWLIPYWNLISYEQPLHVEFELHPGWEQGLSAMDAQPSDEPEPYLSLTTLTPINVDDWMIFLNDYPVLLGSGTVDPNTYQLPVEWTSIHTGINCLDIVANNPGDYVELGHLELCSGPINEIEKSIPPFCGDQNHPRPLGDLSGDCCVNFTDFSMMATSWLDCTMADCSVNQGSE